MHTILAQTLWTLHQWAETQFISSKLVDIGLKYCIMTSAGQNDSSPSSHLVKKHRNIRFPKCIHRKKIYNILEIAQNIKLMLPNLMHKNWYKKQAPRFFPERTNPDFFGISISNHEGERGPILVPRTFPEWNNPESWMRGKGLIPLPKLS